MTDEDTTLTLSGSLSTGDLKGEGTIFGDGTGTLTLTNTDELTTDVLIDQTNLTLGAE